MAIVDNDSHFSLGRSTPQRRSIAEAADGFGSAFTVDELLSATRRIAPGVGMATVYRAVAAMESSGALERVGSRGSSALYARCDKSEHHHHLVCTVCSMTAHTPCPLAPDSARLQAKRDRFTVTSHEITLYGLCGECAALPDRDMATDKRG